MIVRGDADIYIHNVSTKLAGPLNELEMGKMKVQTNMMRWTYFGFHGFVHAWFPFFLRKYCNFMFLAEWSIYSLFSHFMDSSVLR